MALLLMSYIDYKPSKPFNEEILHHGCLFGQTIFLEIWISSVILTKMAGDLDLRIEILGRFPLVNLPLAIIKSRTQGCGYATDF